MKTLKKSQIKSLITRYLLLSFLIAVVTSVSITTYVLFLDSHGMNPWQINLINSAFMATIILMEMPTGSFADKFGRHRSISVSFFLVTLGLSTYYLSKSFEMFIVAEILTGLALTFSSGALEAWLVDSLKFHGLVHLKFKLFRKEIYFVSAGVIIGSLTGSYLGNYNLAWPWILGALISFLAGIYSLTIKEDYNENGYKTPKNGLLKQIKIACSHGFNNRHIVSYMFLGSIFNLAIQAINMQWTLIFRDKYLMEVKYLGWMFVFVALIASLGGTLSKYSLRLFKDEKKTLAFTQILTSLFIIVLALANGLITALSFFFLHELTRSLFKPIKQSFLNDHIQSETRATVLSLDSMMVKVGSFIGLLASGWIAKNYSIETAWFSSGLFLLVALLIFLWPRKKNKNGP